MKKENQPRPVARIEGAIFRLAGVVIVSDAAINSDIKGVIASVVAFGLINGVFEFVTRK